jgi:hypothetical protein
VQKIPFAERERADLPAFLDGTPPGKLEEQL